MNLVLAAQGKNSKNVVEFESFILQSIFSILINFIWRTIQIFFMTEMKIGKHYCRIQYPDQGHSKEITLRPTNHESPYCITNLCMELLGELDGPVDNLVFTDELSEEGSELAQTLTGIIKIHNQAYRDGEVQPEMRIMAGPSHPSK